MQSGTWGTSSDRGVQGPFVGAPEEGDATHSTSLALPGHMDAARESARAFVASLGCPQGRDGIDPNWLDAFANGYRHEPGPCSRVALFGELVSSLQESSSWAANTREMAMAWLAQDVGACDRAMERYVEHAVPRTAHEHVGDAVEKQLGVMQASQGRAGYVEWMQHAVQVFQEAVHGGNSSHIEAVRDSIARRMTPTGLGCAAGFSSAPGPLGYLRNYVRGLARTVDDFSGPQAEIGVGPQPLTWRV